jgi:hypothetical protein
MPGQDVVIWDWDPADFGWALLEASSGTCPALVLGLLAYALAGRGLYPHLTVSIPGGPMRLQIGPELIETTEIRGEHLVVTQSGSYVGFISDPGTLDHLTELLTCPDGPASAAPGAGTSVA